MFRRASAHPAALFAQKWSLLLNRDKICLSGCNYEMETKITSLCLFLAMMRLSPAEELKRNLTGVVGGNITLPDPLMERGSILNVGKANTLAVVIEGKLQILDNKFNNKLLWNKDSGFVTITDLQKIDSGVYKIDDTQKDISFSYSLSVYDAAPTPAVETQTVSSDSCWLICSVDKPTSLMWSKDEEIQNQSSSAVSLPITVYRQDINSSYRCVAANPAENKTFSVDVRKLCEFKETKSGDKRTYWIAPLVSVGFFILIAFVFCMIKQRYLGKKSSVRQTQDPAKELEVLYTPILIKDKRQTEVQEENIPESSGTSDRNNLTTVYAKLELPNPGRA